MQHQPGPSALVGAFVRSYELAHVQFKCSLSSKDKSYRLQTVPKNTGFISRLKFSMRLKLWLCKYGCEMKERFYCDLVYKRT